MSDLFQVRETMRLKKPLKNNDSNYILIPKKDLEKLPKTEYLEVTTESSDRQIILTIKPHKY